MLIAIFDLRYFAFRDCRRRYLYYFRHFIDAIIFRCCCDTLPDSSHAAMPMMFAS